MTYLLEILYHAPADERRERHAAACAASHGGRLDYREEPDAPGGPICLSFKFDARDQADTAAGRLRDCGEHVEGPSGYGE